MRQIKAEYQRIREAIDEENGIIFFSAKHKKSREWHVLGTVQQLLVAAGLEAPTFAEERETPDFRTYLADGRPWAPIEIVEVLRPDYKRHDWYKRSELPGAPKVYDVPRSLEEPWVPLREQLRNKAAKNYPAGIFLIIYYDIGRMSFDDWHTPFHAQLIAEHRRKPFDGLNAFKRVLVLNSDMASLVQLHPHIATIIPDEPDRPAKSGDAGGACVAGSL